MHRTSNDLQVEKYGFHPLIKEFLKKKFITTEGLLKVTLDPRIENLTAPETLPDFDLAIEEFEKFKGKRIVVWGDEDGDGISATVLLFKALKILGYEVTYYIPSKVHEGYGFSLYGINKLLREGYEFFISVDCAGNSKDEAIYLKEKKVPAIITDHHEIPKELPPVPFINPKRGGGSFRFLAGVGVAFKFAWGLLKHFKNWGIEDIKENFMEALVLAAAGTQTDRVPLYSENRAIHREGILRFKELDHPLFEVYEELRGFPIDWETFLQIISSGKSREGKNPGVEVLLSEDKDLIRYHLEELIDAFKTWNKEAEKLLEEALSKVKRTHKYILLDMGNTHPKYLGFLASRLKDKFRVPVIVMSKRNEKEIAAEVRTPYGINSMEILNSLSHLFTDYGGHKYASGFSMEIVNLPVLVEEIEMYFRERGSDLFKPQEEADLVIQGEEGDMKLLEDLKKFASLGVEGRVYWRDAPSEVRDFFKTANENLYIELVADGLELVEF